MRQLPVSTPFPYTTLFRSADNAHVPLGTDAHDNANVTGGVAGFPLPATSFSFNGSALANAASAEAGFEATSVATGADRKSTRLNSSHVEISYADFCLTKDN